jgi:hypothetical protein
MAPPLALRLVALTLAPLTTAAAAADAQGTALVELTGAYRGYVKHGYGGVWDAFPGAPSDQYIVAEVRNQNIPGPGVMGMDVAWGRLTAGSPSVKSFVIGGGGNYKGACDQDTVNFNLHFVSDYYGTGVARYTRLVPTRAGGTITDWTLAADYNIPAFGDAHEMTIWEVIDGAGNHRLLMIFFRPSTPGGGPVDSLMTDVYLAQTSVAAGVSPAGPGDWVGLDNSGSYTYLGRLSPAATGSWYVTDAYVAQHRTSRKVEIFNSQANHGTPGAHTRVALTPKGTSWTGAVGGVIASYDASYGLGCYAVADDQDRVWWTWGDKNGQRFSRVESDGSVTWDAVPPIGRLEWTGGKGFAVTPQGVVGVMDTITDTTNPWARVRFFRGGAWGPWVDMGPIRQPVSTHRWQNPLKGMASVGGRSWFGAMVCEFAQDGASTNLMVASLEPGDGGLPVDAGPRDGGRGGDGGVGVGDGGGAPLQSGPRVGCGCSQGTPSALLPFFLVIAAWGGRRILSPRSASPRAAA